MDSFMAGAEVYVALAPTLIGWIAENYPDADNEVADQAPNTPDPEEEEVEFKRFQQRQLIEEENVDWQNAYLPKNTPEEAEQLLSKEPEIHLPKRTIEEAKRLGTFPKKKAKPTAADGGVTREVASRSSDDRAQFREKSWLANKKMTDAAGLLVTDAMEKKVAKQHCTPWDLRGAEPPAADPDPDVGAVYHMGQHFRRNTQRFADPGGQLKERYAYYNMKSKSCFGKALQYFHPKSGHFWNKPGADEQAWAFYQRKKMFQKRMSNPHPWYDAAVSSGSPNSDPAHGIWHTGAYRGDAWQHWESPRSDPVPRGKGKGKGERKGKQRQDGACMHTHSTP